MSTKHSLEQLINLSKDLFKTCSLNEALIEFTCNKLSKTFFHFLGGWLYTAFEFKKLSERQLTIVSVTFLTLTLVDINCR